MAKYSLRLANIYPNLLNVFGDNGVIEILKRRCQWRDIELIVDEIDVCDNISENLYDIYFLGNGQDKQLIEASIALMRQKEHLKVAQENNAIILAVGGGFQLLGKSFQLSNNEQLQGINLLDTHANFSQTRYISNVSAQSCIDDIGVIVGFENHNYLTFIDDNTQTKPFAQMIVGNGNNPDNQTEGGIKKNTFATNLHGSFLAQNPKFLDYLLKTALMRKYFEDIKFEPLNDDFANSAHELIMDKKY